MKIIYEKENILKFRKLLFRELFFLLNLDNDSQTFLQLSKKPILTNF